MTTRFTRCPQCRTTFRVTPQQLALREGQVRCGHCRTPFNAFSTLVTFKGERAPGPGMEQQKETMTLRDSVMAPADAFTVMSPPPARFTPKTDKKAATRTPQESDSIIHTQPSLRSITHEQKSPPAKLEKDASPTKREKDLSPAKREKDASAEKHEKDLPASKRDKDVPAPKAGKKDDSAAKRAHEERLRRKKKRRKKRVSPLTLVLNPTKKRTLWEKLRLPSWSRPLFYLVSLPGLALLLISQIIVSFHDELASAVPKLKPTLSRGCSLLGCEIRPLSRPDFLAIRAHELRALSNEMLLLSVTLRNRGNIPVAYPTLSLELKDSDDKLLGRQYFEPEAYLVFPDDVKLGAPVSRDQEIRLLLRSRIVPEKYDIDYF